MHILSSFLFACSSNIDNFTVGIAYGIKRMKIGVLANLLIAIISALGTFLSMFIGKVVVKFLSANTANILGSSILILIGIWFIIDFVIKAQIKVQEVSNNDDNSHSNYKKLLQEPERADIDKSGYIDVKESISLAFALTINNLGAGIAASITGLNIFLTTGLTFIFSIIAILIGYLIGNNYFSKVFGKYAALASGIMIVILGIYELFI